MSTINDETAATLRRMGTIGQRLRDTRKAQRLTLEQLGAVAGVTKQAISQIERDITKNPEAATLEPLARRLGIQLHWLMSGRGQKLLNASATENSSRSESGAESHLLTLDQDILHEALTLLVHDEQQAGDYTPRAHTARLAELYARVAADGGRLTAQHNREFTEEVQQRSQGASHATATTSTRRRTNHQQ